MNIGTVQGTLTLKDELSSVLGRAAATVRTGGQQISSAVDSINTTLRSTAAASQAAAAGLRNYTSEGARLRATLDAQIQGLQGLQMAYRSGEGAVSAFNLQQRISAELSRAGVRAESLQGRAIADRIRKVDELTNAIHRQSAAVTKASAKMQTSFKGLASTLFNLRSLIYGVGLGTIAGELGQAQRAADQMRNSLRVTVGTSAAVGRELEYVRSEARRLGLDFASAGKSFAWLAAASRDTGITMDQVRHIFSSVSQAATALGLDAETTSGAFNAIVQMMTKGTVQAEELRGQLGDRLPGAVQAAARAMGMGSQELNKQLKLGKVLATDLLPKLSQEFDRLYKGAALTGAKLLSAEINRLKTAVFDLLLSVSGGIDLTGITRDMTAFVDRLAEAFKSAGAQAGLRNLGDALRSLLGVLPTLVENLDMMVSAVKGIMAYKLVMWLESTRKSMVAYVVAARAGTTASMGYAGAIGVVVAATVLLNDALTNISRRIQQSIDKMVESTRKAGEASRAVRDIQRQLSETGQATVTKDQASSIEERIKEIKAAVAKLQQERAKLQEQIAKQTFQDGSLTFTGKRLQTEAANITGQINTLMTDWRNYTDALNGAKVAQDDTATSMGSLGDETDKLQEKYEKLVKSIELETASIQQAVAAYGLDLAAREAALDAAEVENQLRQEAIELSGQMVDALRPLIAAKIEASRSLVGAEEIDNLKIELSEIQQLNAARVKSINTANSLAAVLETEADVREATAKAAAHQREEIAQLIRDIAKEQANAKDIEFGEELERQVRQMGELIAAYEKGPAAVAQVVAAHEAENDKLGMLADLSDEARVKFESLVDSLIQGGQDVAKEEIFSDLQTQIEHLSLELMLKNEAFAGVREFAEAQRQLNIELELEKAILAAKAPLTQEEIAALRSRVTEVERLKYAISELEDLGDFGKMFRDLNKGAIDDFLNGMQSSLSGFFMAVFEGSANSIEQLGETLKNTLFKVLADYLSEWITLQAKMLAASLKRIAAEKAASKALGTTGTGPVASGDQYASMIGGAYKSYSSAGMSTTALVAAAAVVALAVYGKWRMDKAKAETFGFGTTLGWDYAGGAASVTEGASKASKAISASMRELLTAFQTSTGAYVEGMTAVTIMARNDGKEFSVRMGGVALGTFRDVNDAILKAFSVAMSTAEFSSKLDPAISQVLATIGQSGSAIKTPEALMEVVNLIQQLSDLGAGVTETARAVNGIYRSFEELEARLRSFGVSMADSTRLAGNAMLDDLRNVRDAITGKQRTQEEEMALRQQEAVLFNAHVALVRAELELRKMELEQRLALLSGLPNAGAVGGGSGGVDVQHIDPTTGDMVASSMSSSGGVLADALQGQVEMYAQWAKSTTEITAGALTAQTQMVGVAANTQLDMLRAQIDAINAILDALPAFIMPGEITIPGGGSIGAGASGPSREDRINAVNEELDRMAQSLLPALLSQLIDLSKWYEEQRVEMQALGMDISRLNDLYERHRQQLILQAQQQVGQYTQSPFQQQLRDILRWRDEMLLVYEELGLNIQDVLDATNERVRELGLEIIAGFGTPMGAVRERAQTLRDQLMALTEALAAGAVTAEEYSRALAEVGDMAASELFNLGADLLEQMGLASQAAEWRAAASEMEFALKVAEYNYLFQLYTSLGLIAGEVAERLGELLDLINDPANWPDFGAPGAGAFGGGGRSVRDGGGKTLENSMDALRRAIEKLRDYYMSLLQDESVSPLSLGERFQIAAQQYQDLLADIAAAQGDPEALAPLIDQLPGVAQQYLELAAQMYGTAGGGYQAIFASVIAAIEGILGQYEEPGEWYWLQNSMSTVTQKLSASTGYLLEIRNAIGGWGGGGGGHVPLTGGIEGMVGLTHGAAANVDIASQISGLREDSWAQSDRIESALLQAANAQDRVAKSNHALLTTRPVQVSGLRFRRSAA